MVFVYLLCIYEHEQCVLCVALFNLLFIYLYPLHPLQVYIKYDGIYCRVL